MIVFTSDRTTTVGLLAIFQATRASKADPFGAAVDLTELNSAFDEDTVWLSPDGLRIVYSSNRGPSVDLLTAERATRTSAFTTPQVIAGVSTTTDAERTPWMTSDELEIYFSSQRPGGLGGYDIWHASRPTRTSTFGAADNVAELNTSLDDYAPSLSSDGRALYFNYNASLLGGADANIYVAQRSCP
jgi:Tol biopolymer transport system component